jgi:hypothetical protein
MVSFDTVIPILRSEPVPLEEGTTRSFASAGLPPNGCHDGTSFDWPKFVSRAAKVDVVAVRRTLNLADAEVSADFFGPEDDAARLAKAMEVDYEVS